MPEGPHLDTMRCKLVLVRGIRHVNCFKYWCKQRRQRGFSNYYELGGGGQSVNAGFAPSARISVFFNAYKKFLLLGE
jgi:hypothetical protein